MKCPKCQYARTTSDEGPDYACPKCGLVYAKFDPFRPARLEAVRARVGGRVAKGTLTVPAIPEVPREPVTTTSCPACGGLVAIGAKSCPHCGKSRPAPKPSKLTRPISKRVLVWLAILTAPGLISLALMLLIQPPSATQSQSDSMKDSNLQADVQRYVVSVGYRCDSVSTMRPLLVGTGVTLVCNNYQYSYSVRDRGGRWVVTLD